MFFAVTAKATQGTFKTSEQIEVCHLPLTFQHKKNSKLVFIQGKVVWFTFFLENFHNLAVSYDCLPRSSTTGRQVETDPCRLYYVLYLLITFKQYHFMVLMAFYLHLTVLLSFTCHYTFYKCKFIVSSFYNLLNAKF